MKEVVSEIRSAALSAIAGCEGEKDLDALRVRYLGRKGELTLLVRRMREVPPEQRPAVGALLNDVKGEIERRLAEAFSAMREDAGVRRAAEERIDITIPGTRMKVGSVHPITQVMDALIDVFCALGFSVEDGPDVEDDHHNFEALNFPADHPARDMQDTLFVDGGLLLRTHTSPVQVRVMERCRPPLRVIAPGAVYRHDGDLTHSPMFHQIEGFMVDRHITFADLKGVLTRSLREIFGAGTAVRLRPSFFPFTEPSAEIDIGCFRCSGKDGECRVCKGTGWLEMLGAGLIDPNVFRAVGYDPDEVSGFAFGMGIERIAMCKYQIDDIRLFYGNDMRFLAQF